MKNVRNKGDMSKEKRSRVSGTNEQEKKEGRDVCKEKRKEKKRRKLNKK